MFPTMQISSILIFQFMENDINIYLPENDYSVIYS